jgi:hypothetical protein
MPEEASAECVQQALEGAAPAWWETGLALCRQQGMLQFSPPAQAGVTAAARINSASRRWTYGVTIDFIPFNYKIAAGCMSTGKPGHLAFSVLVIILLQI